MGEYPEKVYVSINVHDKHYIVPEEFASGAVVYERVDVAGYPIISKLEALLADAVKEIGQLKAARAGYAATLGCEVGDVHEKLREVLAQLAEVNRLEARVEELCCFAAYAYRHAWSRPVREYAAKVLGFDNKEIGNG